MDLKLEKSLWRRGYDAVIGIDEVGRGSLAGPMYLCAVILRKEQESILKKVKGVNDSKQLSQKKREAIFEQVVALRIPYIIHKATPKEIDRHNIYWAGIRGCDALIKKYSTGDLRIRRITSSNAPVLDAVPLPHSLLRSSHFPRTASKCVSPTTHEDSSFFVACDGGLFVPGLEKHRQETFIKGDQRVFAIALASVIAKCLRDALMVRLAKKYPHYGWEQNKGYGTKRHIEAIYRLGKTPFHRLTFIE